MEEIDEDGLTAKEAALNKKVLGRDHNTSLFKDLSLADKAIVDGGTSKIVAPSLSSKEDNEQKEYGGISKGTKFKNLLELQMWLKDHAVKYHRPFKVKHSNSKVRYMVKCEEYKNHCPWVVRARVVKGGPQWKITSGVFTHRCRGKDIDVEGVKDDHPQLTSKFIAQRCAASIKILPTYPIKALIDLVHGLFAYTVKYGKAWKAKQEAFEILYGGWEESYNRLPMLLGAMAAANPGMYHVVEPLGSTTRKYNNATVRVFNRAFWAFGPCITAFRHCRPVMSVDGTFLTGKYKGTLLIAVGQDANDRLLPLAFALVSAENNDNWDWFFKHLRTKVIGPEREVCIISDRHQGILNAVEFNLEGHARLHHRWCMRHFVTNFYMACGKKEVSDLLQDFCLAFTARHFKKLYDKVYALAGEGGEEFLRRNFDDRQVGTCL